MKMYRKGEVEVGPVWDEEGIHIHLPHSCDEWVIGGAEEARQLIADLELMIPVWEAKTNAPVRD